MAFATRMLLLFAVGTFTLAETPSGGANAVLSAMRTAAGPVWATHFVSISRLSYNGSTTTVSSESQGLPFTLRRCNGELCDGTYFDGIRLYTTNANDTALPQSADSEPYLRALRSVASLSFLAPAFGADGGRIHDDGTATIDGKRYHALLVADRQALPLRIYVDPQTALVRFARDLHGEDTFEYRDYRKVDGFALPFEVLHNGSVLERYDDRTPVASAFRAPRGLVPVFDGPPQPVPVDPAHITPVFPCSVAGVAVRCLLDTGNSGVSMSSELAAQLDAPVVGAYAVRGLGGYSTQVVRAGPLKIANATFPEAYYVVLNDIHPNGYDVVIGTDVLASTSVALDGAAHTLQFGAVAPPSTITIPMAFENFVPVVKVELGSVEARLLVDTGDESNINLAYDFYSKHPSLFTVTTRRNVKGVGASSVELLGTIPEVTVGTYTTGPQTIGTTQTLAGTAFGHLGAAFLGQFDVQLDYSAAELHLVPRGAHSTQGS
ncbi:MAG: retropepsin-like domain-containing protein [Candidatus Eremiobacteraeota bacterium]|nr:retropepsin-like domain-containing protein [Candidatus Eremiobacteraeota bacterium]